MEFEESFLGKVKEAGKMGEEGKEREMNAIERARQRRREDAAEKDGIAVKGEEEKDAGETEMIENIVQKTEVESRDKTERTGELI